MSLLSEIVTTTTTPHLHHLLIPLALLLLLLLLVVIVIVAQYNRLRHIPGPLLPRLTDTYLQWRLRARGENYVDILHDLHARYGPVVRWGPNRVSFAPAAAIPLIYGSKDVFPKAPSYQPMVVLSPAPAPEPGPGHYHAQGGKQKRKQREIISLITVRDEARLSTIKAQVAAGFSQATWLKQEDQINETLDFFTQRLHEQMIIRTPSSFSSSSSSSLSSSSSAGSSLNTSSRGEAVVVPLDKWLSLWTFDTLSQLAFSDSRGFLAHGRDVDGVFAGSAARFAHWKHWSLLPTLEWWLHKSRLARQLRPYITQKNPPASALVRLATARIEARKWELLSGSGRSCRRHHDGVGGEKEKEKEGGGEEDLLADAIHNAVAAGDSSVRDLVGRFLAASVQNPQAIDGSDVLALTVSTIHAGADTTSSASAHVLANALSQPETWAVLEEEILGAGLACPPSFKEVASLPVLDAVIRESL